MPPPAVVTSDFIGELHFDNEYPTDATVDKLFDQLDFQRGCRTLDIAQRCLSRERD